MRCTGGFLRASSRAPPCNMRAPLVKRADTRTACKACRHVAAPSSTDPLDDAAASRVLAAAPPNGRAVRGLSFPTTRALLWDHTATGEVGHPAVRVLKDPVEIRMNRKELRVAEQGYLSPLDHGAGSFCRSLKRKR